MAIAEEKKLKASMDFLRSIQGFQYISRRALNLLVLSFATETFNFKDFVYKEN